MLVALAGGVGAARMLTGLVQVLDPSDIAAIVNTGDDIVLHGLHISPDLDTVTYTLAGAINPEAGWGLRDETWSAMNALERYRGQTWFRLGDRDLATHMFRTQRLDEGATLTEVTSEIARSWDLELRLLPMSDERVETRVTIAGEGEVGFQEWFVGRRHGVDVEAVRFVGAESAAPGPDVVAAIGSAERIVVCPSNPIVSIGPIRGLRMIETALRSRRDDVVAVSPIVAGAALKGPADRLMTNLGHEPSVVGVARLYSPIAATLVIDEADRALASAVEAEGVRCVVAPTVMHGAQEARRLAEIVLKA